ncbi:MAG: hypothetical protein C0596_11470 [Marinilabiliales bacterium]|nr:MAG: hypothetical protein C0596_11470 [Marinilabiliales bacterium]
MPSNNYEKNKYSILSHVSILEDFKKTKIENKSSFYGNMKCRYIPLFISDYTFCYKDWDEFHTYDYLNTYYKIGFGIRDEGQALKNKSDNSNEELLELQKEYYDSNFEFTIESYDLLSVTNFNSITEDKKLEVSNEMIVSDVIFKIGSDYGLNIGYLIGEQIKLEGSELDRKCDIIRDYAANYSIEIVLTIPEGYTISDISPLITIVENE